MNASKQLDLNTSAVNTLIESLDQLVNFYSDSLYKACKQMSKTGLALKEKVELSPIAGHRGQTGESIRISVITYFKINASDWVKNDKGGLFNKAPGLARHVVINPAAYSVESLDIDEIIKPKTPLVIEFDLDPFTGRASSPNAYRDAAKKIIDDLMEEVSPIVDKIFEAEEKADASKATKPIKSKYSRKTYLLAADRLNRKG